MTNPLRIVPARLFAPFTKPLGTLPGVMLAILATLSPGLWADAPISVSYTHLTLPTIYSV